MKIIEKKFNRECLVVSNAKEISDFGEDCVKLVYGGGTFDTIEYYIDMSYDDFMKFIESDDIKIQVEFAHNHQHLNEIKKMFEK